MAGPPSCFAVSEITSLGGAGPEDMLCVVVEKRFEWMKGWSVALVAGCREVMRAIGRRRKDMMISEKEYSSSTYQHTSIRLCGLRFYVAGFFPFRLCYSALMVKS